MSRRLDQLNRYRKTVDFRPYESEDWDQLSHDELELVRKLSWLDMHERVHVSYTALAKIHKVSLSTIERGIREARRYRAEAEARKAGYLE